jgi:DNA-binding CsgD family transcriptional regulator/tetratricopeptide (TPR) repeat protein
MVGGGLAARGSFVGRGAELAQLEALVDGLRAGIGGVVLVEGEQGIGKSALLRTGLAGSAGCTVLWEAADELGQRFPLSMLADCLAGTDPEPDAGSGGAAAGGVLGGDPVLRAVEGMLAQVDRLCAASPVLLVAEDLQWADEASLLVFYRLSKAVDQLPLLVAGSSRAGTGREDLGRLRRSLAARGSVMDLGPLPDADVGELVRRRVGGRPGLRLAGLFRRVGGNPLYACELTDGLQREGRIRLAGGVAELSGESAPVRVPLSLAAAIAGRLGGLPDEVLTVLRWAAVLGQEFSATDLSVVTGRSAGELLGIIGTAQAAGVVADAGLRLGFQHGLIRQALYEGMPAALRAALHLEAARALAAAGAPPERVAAHLSAVPGLTDRWALDWLATTAPALIYRAPQVAADLLEGLLAQLGEGDPRRGGLEASLVTVQFLLQCDEEAQQVGRRLLARVGHPGRNAEMAWLVAYSMMRTGQAAEATALIGQTLAQPGISEAHAAQLGAIQAMNLAALGQDDQAADVAAAALVRAGTAGDRLAAGYALHALSCTCVYRRDNVAMVGYIDRALSAIGDDPRVSDLRLLLLSNKVGGLSDLDRQAEALATARRALVLAEQVGTPRLAMIRLYLGNCYFEAGQWDDAITEAEAAPGLLVRAVHELVMHAQLALIAVHRDDPETAAEHLRAVPDGEIDRPANGPVAHLMVMAQAVAAERDSQVGEAARVLGRCLEPGKAERLPNGYLLLPMLTRLALARGATGDADAAAAAARQEADREPLARKAATADHCRGLLTGSPVPVLAAADYWEAAGRPLEQALALEDAAVLAAAASDRPAARQALAAAVALYGGLGARWDIRRATARLHRHGIRRGRGNYQPRPATGWAALTPTEVRVARLVATGMSNPDIAARLLLSRNTVQTHVSHILAKLGTRSRAQIIGHAIEQQPDSLPTFSA